MSVTAVLLPVGPDRYAVPARLVREVVADPRPTRLPTAPTALVGLFNLRGEVVPAFDTAALLGIGHVEHAAVAVVVTTNAGPAGLIATGLPEVRVLDDELRPSELRGTSGIYDAGDGVVVMLDLEVLLGPGSAGAR